MEMQRLILYSAAMDADSLPVTVLVIDDDAMSRDLLSLLLEDQGYIVQTADSGAAAIALLRRGVTHPTLVLTDCQMPDTTPRQLATELRQACGSSTLLLAMSGSEPPASEIAAFDGFLLKPFPIQAVSEMLTAHQSSVAKRTPKAQNLAPRATSEEEPASNEHMSAEVLAPAGPASLAALVGDTPVLNESIFEKLALTLPIRQLLEMYIMCVNDARQRIALMRACVREHDSAQFIREAHAIKGSSGMLGATQLHGMAAELEKTGLASPDSHSQQDVNSLDELSAACDRLERMLGSRVQA